MKHHPYLQMWIRFSNSTWLIDSNIDEAYQFNDWVGAKRVKDHMESIWLSYEFFITPL